MTIKNSNRILALVAALAAIFVLASCGGKLRPDPAQISAIDAGYPTVEFRACGKVFNGIGLCQIKEGDLYDTVKLMIQGYGDGNGTVRVDAKNCDLGETFQYKGSSLIPMKISGRAGKNCLITFVVAPNYKAQKGSGIVVYPLRGHLAIKVTRPDDDWEGNHFKRTGAWVHNHKAWIGGEGQVQVKMSGCGRDYDQMHELMNGEVTIPIHKASDYSVRTCVIEGIVISPKYEDLFFTYVVAQYKGTYPVISKPLVEIEKGKLKVTADTAVSIISLNNEYKLAHEGSFKFDQTQPAILRALTVKGRNTLGLWDPKKKVWTWIQ